MKEPIKNIERRRLLSLRQVFSAGSWVKVNVDSVKLPSGRVGDDYYLVDLPEYVISHARDRQGRVLFERQYKHTLGGVF